METPTLRARVGSCVMRKGSGSGGGQWHDGCYGYLGVQRLYLGLPIEQDWNEIIIIIITIAFCNWA